LLDIIDGRRELLSAAELADVQGVVEGVAAVAIDAPIDKGVARVTGELQCPKSGVIITISVTITITDRIPIAARIPISVTVTRAIGRAIVTHPRAIPVARLILLRR
jgi:hypothetical protein